jgi:UDP-2,3-diacylglucosamine pyrophosphatase LpxH
MNRIYSILTLFFVFITFFCRANDTLFKLAQPLATAHNWNYKGGGTNLDASPTWKSSLTFPETGWLTNRPAPFRFGTTPPASNTTIPGDNTAGGAGPTGARYPTLYFRKVVNIANPGAYINFKINAKFDDAIVVWVNGQEAFRNNIIANPSYATLSTTSMAGDGATIISGNVNTSLFNTGNNIIAVEIHQTTATSGDLFFDMELIGVNDIAVSRGPYLQMGGQTGITIRWRTDVATNSRVTYGTTLGSYTNTVDDAAVTTEHIVNLSGLSPDTKYFYTVGSSSTVLQSGAPNYFVTVPPPTANRKMRIAAFGDCGFVSANQTFTRQAYMSFLNGREIDAFIMMGDNVYDIGTDAEWQTNFFDPYKDVFLKNWKMYPVPGNHDYGNTNSQAETNNRNNNYYQNFTLPTAGQLGGVASGTEAFYSFDIGDIHFLALDSYGRETASANSKMYDTLTAQAVWVKNDLAANTKKWVVAYWHHAPYTKIGLNSDAAGELTNVRENFIRILERYGVDLVICGHSHGYERSYLLKNYYKATPASPALLDADFRKNLHTADSSSALYNGTAGSCAYTYNSGQYNHGTVYTVSGSAGKNDQVAQAGYPHDAMYFSQTGKGGAFYFEVDSNRLDAKYIWQNGNSTPIVGDSFTVFKDVKKFTTYSVAVGATLNIQSSWKGTYNWYAGGTSAPNLSTSRSFSVPTGVAGTYRYVVKDFSNNTCLRDSFEVVVNGALPVLISSFTATLNNRKVNLNWSTSLEQNNKHFTIEKSTNGLNFEFFTQVKGAGNSNIPTHYKAVDNAPADGVNYYRLSQTDIDGKTNYFGIKTINYKSHYSFSAGIVNVPDGVTVNIFNNKSGNMSVQIVDIMGRKIKNESFFANTGTIKKSYSLLKGIYIIQVSNNNNEVITNKIIIK